MMATKNDIPPDCSLVSNCLDRENRLKTWQSPHMDGLEIIESNEHIWSYPEHLHEALEIIWVISGEIEITCCGGACIIRPGQACVIHPLEVHTGKSVSELSCRFVLIHIPAGQMKDHIQNSTFRRTSGFIIESDGLGMILSEMIESIRSSKDGREEAGVVSRFLSGLYGSTGDRSILSSGRIKPHPAVEQIISLFEGHSTEGMDNKTLARAVGLNKRYLISLFRDSQGVSPHKFLVSMKIDRGRRLIESDVPLNYAALDAGFADQSHFTRHFKRHYGVTPGAFRRSQIL